MQVLEFTHFACTSEDINNSAHGLMLKEAVQQHLLPVMDKVINNLDDLQVGSTVRGFIKSVAEHCLFVNLGRGIDARVQIKELFDEVSLAVYALKLPSQISQ